MDTYGLDFWKAYKAAGFAQVTGRDGRSARIGRVTTANVFVCYAGDSRRYATHRTISSQRTAPRCGM